MKYYETSEKSIEAYMTNKVRESGGLSIKFSSHIQTGFPDRIVMLPGGLSAWVELKSHGERPRKIQSYRHGQLRSVGQRVFVIDSREKVDAMLNELKGTGI